MTLPGRAAMAWRFCSQSRHRRKLTGSSQYRRRHSICPSYRPNSKRVVGYTKSDRLNGIHNSEFAAG